MTNQKIQTRLSELKKHWLNDPDIDDHLRGGIVYESCFPEWLTKKIIDLETELEKINQELKDGI